MKINLIFQDGKIVKFGAKKVSKDVLQLLKNDKDESREGKK